MKKIEINFNRNKMIIAKKAQIIKNYKDPMVNYKID